MTYDNGARREGKDMLPIVDTMKWSDHLTAKDDYDARARGRVDCRPALAERRAKIRAELERLRAEAEDLMK